MRNLFVEAFIVITLFLSLILLTGCDFSDKDKLPIALIATQHGNIHIEIDTSNAPISANNFIAYVKAGQFNGSTFYRTVNPTNDNHPLTITVLQGGINADFSNDFSAAYPPIAHESTKQTGLKHVRGAISFARGNLGTAQTEFFISLQDNPALDHGGLRHPDKQGFAVFGKVIKGMDIVDKIARLPSDKVHADEYVNGQILNDPVIISDISIVH
ncbi:peptidylprolyl isomerase [Ningiella sp. W23]|uniref:peptidylprolyl isomerase n=1 Tax=Ningiella sp. W23 TaxID=3023715 RepID=UPI003756C168